MDKIQKELKEVQKKLENIEKKQEMMNKLYDLEKEQQQKMGKQPSNHFHEMTWHPCYNTYRNNHTSIMTEYTIKKICYTTGEGNLW